MSDMTIREAREADIPRLAELLYQVHRVHSDVRPDLFRAGARKYSDAELTELLRRPQTTPVFVAEKEGTVVGYAFCIHKETRDHPSLADVKTLYIDDLCVDAACRGGGIGKALSDFVVAYARENEYYNVTLNVWADNRGAVAFYEKIGMHVQKIGMEEIL